MRALGVIVRNIQTDRGSEYFSQEEGDLIEDRDRNLHKFGEVCLTCSKSEGETYYSAS